MKDAFDKSGMDAKIDPKAVAVSVVAKSIAAIVCTGGTGVVTLAAVGLFKLLTRDR